MPFPSQLFTQNQLATAVGGPSNLLDLVDKQATKDLNSASCQAFIAEIQQAALGEVCSLLQVPFDPSDPTFAGAAFVQQVAVTIGVYWAWHKSTGGLAIPTEVKDAHADARTMLESARDGLRALGTATDPASNSGATNVDIDDTGTRILRKNMNGFC